ncbi:MAG: hypothetical protein ACR2FJ_06840 [Qipengyuania sp.]
MSDTSFASLSSTLLARKGGAKPAMRPQLGVHGKVDGAAAAANLEDLGWNDMGEDEEPAPQAAPTPAIRLASPEDEAGAQKPAPSPVRDTIERIAQKLEAPAMRPAANAEPARAKSIPSAASKRAAFTLRLDADRHLKLRLACTVRNCSAQQFVTDALDGMLAHMPEIEQLAAQVKRD